MYLEPISKIEVKLGLEDNGPVQAFLTDTCRNHMDKYVPIDTGDLRSNVYTTKNTITYASPYAHYMYEGRVMGPNIPITKKGVPFPIGYYSPKGKPKQYTGAKIQYHKAGTGDHWDKRMISAEINQVTAEVEAYMQARKGSGV